MQSAKFRVRSKSKIVVGGIVKTAAEGDGGNDEARRRIDTFAPQKMAGNTGSATELTQTRREWGSVLLRRDFRTCTAETGETAAGKERLNAKARRSKDAKGNVNGTAVS